jgi:hypothetical protein
MKNKPTSKPAVIYNQDELSDYATYGGSVASLFADEIKAGNRIVVIQQPTNAPPTVLCIIESEDDLKRLRDAQQKMREWLEKALGGGAKLRAVAAE